MFKMQFLVPLLGMMMVNLGTVEVGYAGKSFNTLRASAVDGTADTDTDNTDTDNTDTDDTDTDDTDTRVANAADVIDANAAARRNDVADSAFANVRTLIQELSMPLILKELLRS